MHAYQFEGAWNADDKRVSNMDQLFNEYPSGRVAADFYHRYKEDIQIAKNIGLNHFRFSLSWTRIILNGSNDNISQAGLKFYHNVIDEILNNGMEPFVTIYHYDHPVGYDEFTGWLDERMKFLFVNYSRVVFENFGSKVKFWTTINEPDFLCNNIIVTNYYNNKYKCVYMMLKAHAAVYHMYDKEFRAQQGGKIGIIGTCNGYLPKDENSRDCSSVLYEADCGWIFNPIFSKDGDWSDVIKNDFNHPHSESIPKPPPFTSEEIQYIKGTSDYLGFTYYTAFLCETKSTFNSSKKSSYDTIHYYNGTWTRQPDSPFSIFIIPEALRSLLLTIKEKYGNPSVYIMENGSGDNKLNDTNRIEYIHSYMNEAILAREVDGCNVEKYTYWSFMDGFEWGYYQYKMGLVEVDFDSVNLTRTPRLSSKWLRKVIKDRELVKYEEGMEL